jgi:hypothetical protein
MFQTTGTDAILPAIDATVFDRYIQPWTMSAPLSLMSRRIRIEADISEAGDPQFKW